MIGLQAVPGLIDHSEDIAQNVLVDYSEHEVGVLHQARKHGGRNHRVRSGGAVSKT